MPEQWSKVRALFEAALDLPEAERRAFVEQASEDQEVLVEVLRLLDSATDSPNFLEAPPAILAGAVLGYGPRPPLLAPGNVLAKRFRIERFLGRGGMGEVYEAGDSQSHTYVALKVIREDIADQPQMIARLRAEMVLARSVTHRNVCRVFELHESGVAGISTGAGNGTPELLFITMELLRGETLSKRLERTGPLSPQQAGNIVKQLIAALSAAHEAGVVHGDLKPLNIMLEPMGGENAFRAVIMDFGIAAASGQQASSVLTENLRSPGGSPGYMPPEQSQQRELSPATDIYALGVVILEMLTGRKPPAAGLRRNAAISATLPSEWKRVVRRCLEADPKQRFQTAGEVLQALQGRFSRFSAAAIAILLLTLAVGSGYLLRTPPPAPQTHSPTIAVLGFRNISGEAKSGYLSLLISLALNADLAAAGKVRVLPAEVVARSKAELHLPDVDSLSSEARMFLRSTLGADVLILGSYSSPSVPGQLQLEMFAEDARSGRQLAQVSASGEERNLPALLSRAGSLLRAQLHLGSIAGDADRIADSLPGSFEAMRLYAEGVKQLRSFNALGARDYLQRAVAAEPEFALAHSALATAWARLGYDRRAEQEDKKALGLSSKLSENERLQIESDYWQRAHEPEKSIEAARALLKASPDNPDYLLRLAGLQRGGDALATIRRIRALPAPWNDDPRIDLAEADAADKASDFRLEMVSATRAAEKAARSGALILEADARIQQGWSSWILGQLTYAETAYLKARDLYGKVGDQNGVATALRGLALVADKKGDLVKAEHLLDEAVKIFSAIGAQSNAALAINTRALVASSRGKLTQAAELYNASLSVCRELQDPRCSGRALNNIGYVLFRLGRPKEARVKLDEALAQYKLARHSYATSFVLSSLGDILTAQGRFAEAQTALDGAITLSRKVGDQSGQASTQISMAELLAAEGKPIPAGKMCRRGLALEERLGEIDVAAKNRLLLARIELAQEHPAAAAAEVHDALPILLRSGRVDELAQARGLEAEAEAALGHPDIALQAVDESMRIMAQSESQLARMRVLLAVGRAQNYCGQHERAIKTLGEVERKAGQSGFIVIAQQALQLLRSRSRSN